MTDEKKIEQLMNAFYNGDTTPEEEALLLDFFNNKSLNENWYADRDMFNALYDSSEITLPEGMTERLEKAIDKHIAENIIVEHPTKTTIPDNEVQIFAAKSRKIFMVISSAAAVILLCVGLFFINNEKPSSQFIADTYTNPKDAAVAAEQALMLVSDKLNKGFSSLEKVREGTDKTNKLLNENFKIN